MRIKHLAENVHCNTKGGLRAKCSLNKLGCSILISHKWDFWWESDKGLEQLQTEPVKMSVICV